MKLTFDLNFWVLLQLFILPVLLPLFTGLVTTRVTSSSAKALLLLGLSVVTAFATNILAAQQSGASSFDLSLALITALVTFVLGVGMHFGLLRPTGATDVVQAIGAPKSNPDV